MKKKILLAGAVALMAAAAVTGYTAHSKTVMVDLLSANVEALAQNEGTKVSSCYLEKMSGFPGWYQICDRETSPSMIFPVLKTQLWLQYQEFQCVRIRNNY